MKDGYKRLIIIIIIMLSALLLIVGVNKVSGRYGLYHFLKGEKIVTDESVHLPFTPAVSPGDVPMLTKLSMEYANLSKAVMPSVVSINTASTDQSKAKNTRSRLNIKPTGGQGSGVIVSEEGHIITNYHVIADKKQVIVTLANAAQFEAILIGYDPSIDIAVLKIEASYTLVPLKLGNSDKVCEGHIALAFGNPFGIGKSVTNGIISARKTSSSDRQISLFQTNVAINPGNSGGPLVNVIGEVIGINSSIFSSDKDNPAFIGISFAIPSNMVKKSFLDILQYKRPMRGYLGLYAEDLLSPKTRQQLGYRSSGGVLVYDIEEKSPAAKADIRKTDIIVSFDGHRISNNEDLMQKIHASPIDKDIEVTLWRNKQLTIIDVKLEQIDAGIDTLKTKQHSQEVDKSILKSIGISTRTLSRKYNINGVRVTKILKGSLADGNIRVGDIIYIVNGRRIYNTQYFNQILTSFAPNEETRLYIIRDNKRPPKLVVLPQINRW